MRVLVTGGCGFIGSHLVRRLLLEPGVEVVNLDALTYAADPEALEDDAGNPAYRFVHGDVCVLTDLQEALSGCDAVMHLAAESHVDRSLHRAADFVRTNVLGTQMLLSASREAGVGRFLHVSTDEVYGSVDEGWADEAYTLEPSSPYSASKASSDLIALAAQRSFGQDVVVTRCSNNYGPRQFLEKFIPLTITNLLDGVPVPIYGDGGQSRDWLFVDDHCEALLVALREGVPGEVYNIGAEQEHEWTNLEIATEIARLAGADRSLLQHVEDRPGHDRRYALDSSKLRALGWAPAHDLESGLAKTVDWYRAMRSWWAARVPPERSRPGHQFQAGSAEQEPAAR